MPDLLRALIGSTMGKDNVEFTESQVLDIATQLVGNKLDAAILWEQVSSDLRQPHYVDGIVLEWNLFRRTLLASRLPSAAKLRRIAELYSMTTPIAIEANIRGLTGMQFETFVGELLPRLPSFQDVVITQFSRDGGVDFRGRYAPDLQGPEWPLVGQAKQLARPITSSEARDFVGALDTCGEKRPVGFYISTNGYSAPAIAAFRACNYQIIQWSMDEILKHVLTSELGMRRLNFEVNTIDDTFWSEI